ncbi:hypothetical protein MTR67_030419 [Solanum verrucosum]|uniref:SAC domain-containing protein n=1 Tax=Solanum verrucosum TaxID=315347 RepID=A0AAF0R5Z2_SOLVR|nr:hypothetical protein MTR67_030419 [Solanum verrucosum]
MMWSWYRYRKLLCMVDLTKDFFFSYSYHVMRSLQKNMCDNDTGPDLYDSMFVWNEYMTRGTRNLLHNTIWTVALVYGFFKQETLSLSGRDFKLTLIARRSRHYAGTRLSACIHAEHCPFGQYLVEVERKYFKASAVFGYKIHLDERTRKAMNRLEEIDHGRLHEQEDSIATAERDSLFSVS